MRFERLLSATSGRSHVITILGSNTADGCLPRGHVVRGNVGAVVDVGIFIRG